MCYSNWKFYRKIEIIENAQSKDKSTQFFTPIPNMIALLSKVSFLMTKIENYRQNSANLGQNLVKVIFLNKEKKREKRDAYFCGPWYDESNEIKHLTLSFIWKN